MSFPETESQRTAAAATAAGDGFRRDLSRPVTPVEGELDYSATTTAPIEWVPFVYSEAELGSVSSRRGLAVSSAIFGAAGLGLSLFGVWGAGLSLVGVMLAVVLHTAEPEARALRNWGLYTGIAGLIIATGWILLITQVVPAPLT